MANSAKQKGDRGERAAIAVLQGLVPDLMLPNAMRKLGAGRKEDTGDLHAFADVAVQVRNVANLGYAIRSSAIDAVTQAGHAGVPFALGMVPVPNARSETVNWVACCLTWPVALAPDEIAVFGNPLTAVKHVRNEGIGVPRVRRIAIIRRAGTEDIYLSPLLAWFAGYRVARMNIAAPIPVLVSA